MTILKKSFLLGMVSCLFLTLAHAESLPFASTLASANQLMHDRHLEEADALLEKISFNELTVEQKNQFTLLSARIALLQHDGDAVLHLLERIEKPDTLSTNDAITYHLLAAHAYVAEKKPLPSIRERIALQFLIKDEKNKQLNYEKMWQTLQTIESVSPEVIDQESIEVADWLRLASIVNVKPQTPETKEALAAWKSQHPHHPALQFLTVVETPAPTPVAPQPVANATAPEQIKVALLLPMSGAFAEAGKAIQTGFIAAQESDPKLKSILSMQVYDTNQTPNINALYDKALREGARFVIGPMQKNAVVQLSKRGHFEVPTLALNYTPIEAQQNFFQFGLSPQDEAAQVAKRALIDGKRSALILAPKDEWGQGIVESFISAFQAEGGHVVGAVSYGKTDVMNTQMRKLLEIDKSMARRNDIQQVIGSKMDSDVRHRQDGDMLFVVGSPTIARQIRPLLKFYYANSLPVYSSSMIYTGMQNPQNDRDNDGVRFCDMPFVLQANQFHTKQQQITKIAPRGFANNARLYAIGLDSAALVAQLIHPETFPRDGLAATSGRLFLNNTQQISRELLWASFRNGVPTLI